MMTFTFKKQPYQKRSQFLCTVKEQRNLNGTDINGIVCVALTFQ